jgi:DNA-binding NarL/FixJ family response regulator
MALPKWNEEREDKLTNFVGDESPVTQETVAEAAEVLETSTRSVSSKLRKMGYKVELASARATRAFTDQQEATLEAFVTENSGEYTYAQIAEAFEDGAFTPKSIQGKILSMELTSHVKPAPKPESRRTYSPEEEVVFVKMVNEGAFVEDIAEALGRTINSIRGKALSLLRTGEIDAIPRQKHTKGSARKDPLAELGDVSGMTVEEIADEISKTERGVKTMLTRRGLVAADWDGAARKEKAAAAA